MDLKLIGGPRVQLPLKRDNLSCGLVRTSWILVRKSVQYDNFKTYKAQSFALYHCKKRGAVMAYRVRWGVHHRKSKRGDALTKRRVACKMHKPHLK